MTLAPHMMRAMLLFASVACPLAAQSPIASPDDKLYAVAQAGQKVGKGEEIGRFAIFRSAGDQPASILHIWLTEPDGTARVGIRGCESFGWIDNTRFYCQGSINPSTGVYLWFDATTGKELGEALGDDFVWSPDHRALANLGNVPHFSPADSKSDSLEVAGHVWPPAGSSDGEQHWFRSDLSWSPDGKYVAVVDHQRRKSKAFYLEIIECATGKAIEHKLHWADEADEWPPDHDFAIHWSAAEVTVDHGSHFESFRR